MNHCGPQTAAGTNDFRTTQRTDIFVANVVRMRESAFLSLPLKWFVVLRFSRSESMPLVCLIGSLLESHILQDMSSKLSRLNLLS